MSYSIQRVTSDGTLTDVVVGIEFMSQDDIQVYVDEILADGTRDYSYTWVNSNTIRLEPVVAVGSEVLVVRSTYIDTMLHDYEAGAVFNPKSMDENFTQLLYNVQEGVERTNITDIYNDVNMHNHNIKNLAVAVDDYDAIPFIQYKEDALGAVDAAERAEDAADRAEAAAGSSAIANQLAERVYSMSPANTNVFWKGSHLFNDAVHLYTPGGVVKASFVGDGNIAGTAWSIPESVGVWTPTTNDLHSYLRYGGLNNGHGRLPGATVAYSASMGMYVDNNDTGLGGQIVIRNNSSGSHMAIMNYTSPISGRGGLNFVGCGANGVVPNYAPFHARIDNAGQFQAQSNIFAGGDIQAFVPVNTERGALADTLEAIVDKYSNVTTLEANPAEFGLLDIVEKLAAVIIDLKDRITTLEGQVNANAPR